MNSKFVALVLLVAVATAAGQLQAGPAVRGVNPWIPPWISAAPWYPQWQPCTFLGSSCLDCSTKLVCTKFGALQKLCDDPLKPHCNLGKCSEVPSEECAPKEDAEIAA